MLMYAVANNSYCDVNIIGGYEDLFFSSGSEQAEIGPQIRSIVVA